jgi:carbamoylphosphate synthase large subunit
MGIHTGDSITVARRKRTDKEYQRMRDASIAVLRRSASTRALERPVRAQPKDGQCS